jgi:hypothetical protein
MALAASWSFLERWPAGCQSGVRGSRLDKDPNPVVFRDQPRAFQERFFYERLARLFFLRFGDEHGPWAAGAWASAREEGLSPVVALRHIFFFFIGRPHDQSSDEGKLLEEICNAWAWGKDGGPFRTTFASDLVDVLAGRETRSFFGGDLGTGPPLPIDIWGLRQAGFVDEQMRELLDEAGLEAPNGPLAGELVLDAYEAARSFFIARASALNAAAAGDASNWTPHQAEAAGRFELQRPLDLDPLTADEIFEEANLDG